MQEDNKMRTSDFFYENGEVVKELLKLLLGDGEEENIEGTEAQALVVHNNKRIDIIAIRMYKFIIATKILTEEGAYTVGRKGNGCQKISKEKYKQLCSWMKKQIDILNPSTQNQIFCEKVAAAKKDILYFQEYLRKEINTISFWNEFYEFCENCGIIHKRQTA